jgi:uncharacterized protein with beta-barrel porin domain
MSLLNILRGCHAPGRSAIMVAGLALYVPAVYALPPTAVNDTRSILINNAATINVLANDFDPEGLSLTVLTVAIPANGDATINTDGSIRYTPTQGFIGTDSFSYTISNSLQETASALVTIIVSDVKLEPLGDTANNQSVGAVIDTLCPRLQQSTSSDLSPGSAALLARCEGIFQLARNNPAAVNDALQSIAAEEVSAQVRQASGSARTQTQAVGQRQTFIAHGHSSVSINGYAVTPDTWKGGGAGDELNPLSRLNVFLSAQIEDARRDQTEREAGYDASAQGLTIGADYRLQDNLFIGLALGWNTTSLDFSLQGGGIDTDIFTGIGYLSWSDGPLTLDAQFGLGKAAYDTRRRILYDDPTGGVNTTAVGNTAGSQWTTNLRMQWDLQTGGYSILPFARAEYLATTIDGYGENGGNGWEVQLGDQRFNQLTMALGSDFSYAWNQSWGVLLPQASLSVISEVNTSRDDVTGRFVYDLDPNNRFVLLTDNRESLYYLTQVGAVMVLPAGISAYLQYQYMLGYTNLSTQQIGFGLRYEF